MIRNLTPPPSDNVPDAAIAAQIESSIASVREALGGMRYGQISLTVHEGRVVQIDVTEKKRLKP